MSRTGLAASNPSSDLRPRVGQGAVPKPIDSQRPREVCDIDALQAHARIRPTSGSSTQERFRLRAPNPVAALVPVLARTTARGPVLFGVFDPRPHGHARDDHKTRTTPRVQMRRPLAQQA